VNAAILLRLRVARLWRLYPAPPAAKRRRWPA